MDAVAPKRRGRPAGPEPTCTVTEAAEALRISHWTVRDWLVELCSDGKPVLPHRKIGNRIRIPVKHVNAVETRLALRLGPRRPSSFFSERDG
jgi:hypothetical protein